MVVTKNAEIRLSYYKQGDDLKASLVHTADGNIDIGATIDRHVSLLHSSIHQLLEIKNRYHIMKPQVINLEGDCHFIGITGSENFINSLIHEGLVDRDPFDSDSDSELSDKMSEDHANQVMGDLIQRNYDDDDGSESEPENSVGSELVHNINI